MRNQLLALTALLVLALGTAAFAVAPAATPDLDGQFGKGGIVRQPAGQRPSQALAVNRYGRYVTASDGVRGFRRSGKIDKSYGSRGIARVPFPASFTDLFYLGDNDVVACGDDNGSRLVVARWHRGKLDPDFGNDGVYRSNATAALDRSARCTPVPGNDIAVTFSSRPGLAASESLTVLRLDAQGESDAQFGDEGMATADFSTRVQATDLVAPRSGPREGTIVVGGNLGKHGNRDIGLAAFDPDGTLDGKFGRRGIKDLDLGGDDRLNAIASVTDGRNIVLGGSSDGKAALAGLRSDGRIDKRYGKRGIASTGLGRSGEIGAITPGPQRGVGVIAGVKSRAGEMVNAVAFYDARGDLNRYFSGNGKALIPVYGRNPSGLGIAVSRNGAHSTYGLVGGEDGAGRVRTAAFRLRRFVAVD